MPACPQVILAAAGSSGPSRGSRSKACRRRGLSNARAQQHLVAARAATPAPEPHPPIDFRRQMNLYRGRRDTLYGLATWVLWLTRPR